MEYQLEAVYYSQQVPWHYAPLTFLSLVFDKIYFPGVYLPENGYDEKELIKEIDRIRSIKPSKVDDIRMINCMILTLELKHISDFCVFTGEKNQPFGKLEDGANELTWALEELIYGPPPPNFHPIIETGFTKGLPGGEEAIHAPGWITYPANALIYSAKNNIPLVNDVPSLPVPALGNQSPENNGKLLSIILAIESVKLILPKIPVLTPVQISEFRSETSKHVKSFRLAMLSLSKELNSMLSSDMEMKDIQAKAKFLAETTVYPQLEELKDFIESPKRPWTSRAIDFIKATPQLVSSFFTLPTNIAVANVLAKFVDVLSDIRNESIDKNQVMKRSNMYYLLKIQDMFKK